MLSTIKQKTDKQSMPALTQQFLAWQCLIRQYSTRQLEGQPPTGAQPQLQLNGQNYGSVVVLISKIDATEMIAQFRFIAKKMHDPRLMREAALKHLAETYYQKSNGFSDQLSALFKLASPLAKNIVSCAEICLTFTQANQLFTIPCKARLCDEQESLYQFTYWHNYLFNPVLPAAVDIVCFSPVWEQASFTDLHET